MSSTTLAPTIRDIARRCRTSSIRRKWLREFELHHAAAREKIDILNQGTLGRGIATSTRLPPSAVSATMTKITAMDELGLDGRQP